MNALTWIVGGCAAVIVAGVVRIYLMAGLIFFAILGILLRRSWDKQRRLTHP